MIMGDENGIREPKHKKEAPMLVSGKDGGAGAGGRAHWPGRDLQAGKYCPGPAVALATKISAGRDFESSRDQAGSEAERRSSHFRAQRGEGEVVAGPPGDLYRAASHEKKESLGLEGPMYGKHLSKSVREELMKFIEEHRERGAVTEICQALQLHERSYYRWKRSATKSWHGGGGGKNKITPKEEAQGLLGQDKTLPGTS